MPPEYSNRDRDVKSSCLFANAAYSIFAILEQSGSAELTPFGHDFVRHYRTIKAKAHEAVAGEPAVLAAATAKPLANS